MQTLVSRLRWRAAAATILGIVAGSGCAGGGGDPIGGVLIVAEVQVAASPGDLLAGGTLQLTATARTSTGIVVPGRTVVWSTSAGSVAQVEPGGLVRGIAPGTVIIRAEVEGVTGQLSLTVKPVPVATVEVILGAATLTAGETTTAQAIARDSVGGVLPGRQATWGSSNSAIATVSSAGLVTTIGAGSTMIQATIEGRVGSAPLTVEPRTAVRVGFVAQPTTTVAGQPVAPAIAVAFQDAAGVTATNATGVITLSLTGGPAGAALSGTLSATAVAGVASFPDVRLTRAGQGYILQAAAAGLAPGTSSAFTITPAAAAALAVVGPPAGSGASGVPLVVQPIIELRDGFGNGVAQSGVSVTASIAGGQGTLSGTVTVATDGNGRAAFTNLAIVGPAGSYTLRFQATGLTEATSTPITLGAGGANHLTFASTPPMTATNAVPLAPAIRVQISDNAGNPVNQGGTTITASIASGAGVLSGTLTAVTGASGEATFGNLIMTGVVGNFSVQFSAPNLTAVVTNVILLSAGAEQTLTFVTAPPGTAVNGATLTATPVVQLRDVGGNPVAKAGVPVQVTAQAAVTGVLQGVTSQMTDAAGQATFAGLSLLGQVGAYTLTFESAGLASAVSNPVQLQASPAAAIAFGTAPPAGAVSGTALSPQPSVQVVDQSGNPVAQSGLLVTATASGGAVLANATATTDATGLATFSGLAITGGAGGYVLTFAAPGFPDLPSGTITLGSGAPASLAFITMPPAGAVNGVALSPQPVVEIRDGSGNPVLVAGTDVTASLASGPLIRLLTGTTTVQTDAAGRATFTNLALVGLPGTYVIRFSAPGVPALDSDDIVVTVGLPAQLLFTDSPPAAAANGTPFSTSTVISLGDLVGNLVVLAGVPIQASIASGPGAVLGGTTTRSTAGGGDATFDDLVLTGTAGNYVLQFTAAGLTTATSNQIALGAGPASKLVFVNSPGIPASGASGDALTPAPVIQLRDVSDNNVAQAGVTITAAILSPSGNGAVLTGASEMTDANGRATFSGLTITGPAANYELAFTSAPLSGLTSPPVAISSVGPVKLGFVTPPSSTAINGVALAQQPVIELLDASDVPVAEAGRPVTVAIATGAPGLTGTSLTVMTDASGRASFSGLTITGVTGIRTLEFTSPNLTEITSGDIDVGTGPAVGLVIVTPPPSSTIGAEAFTSDPAVRLVDAGGNPVDSAGVSITVAVSPASAILTGPTTAMTAADGTVSFGGLSLTGSDGTYVLEFSGAGLTPVESAGIDLIVPAGIVITVEPSATAASGVLLGTQPELQVEAPGGVPLSGVTVTVDLVEESGTPGTLVGTTTLVTGAGGVAAWSDLAIQTGGASGQFRLRFRTASGAEVLSAVIDIP